MKRSREWQTQPADVDAGEQEAFACSLSPNGSGFCLSVQLPGDVVASTPVLSELADLTGSSTVRLRPQCFLAWLAWHAHHHQQGQRADAVLSPPWDADVDAFNVRFGAERLDKPS